MSDIQSSPVIQNAQRRSLATRMTELAAAEAGNKAEETNTSGTEVQTSEARRVEVTETKPADTKTEQNPEVKEEAGIDLDLNDLLLGDEEPETPEAKKPGEFDESAFDKETEELAAQQTGSGASDAFKKLRNELKDLKKNSNSGEVDTLKARVAELELEAKKAKSLEERVSTMSKKDAQLAVQASDEYQREVVQAGKRIEERVIALAQATKLDPRDIMDIVQADDATAEKLLAEYGDEINRRQADSIYNLSEGWRDLKSKAKSFMENAEKSISEIRSREEAASAEQAEADRKEARREMKSYFDKYKDIIPGFTKDGALTEEAKMIESKLMGTDILKLSKKDLSMAAFAARALPSVLKRLVAAEKDLAAYRKGQAPVARTGLAETTTGSGAPQTAPKTRGFLAGAIEKGYLTQD